MGWNRVEHGGRLQLLADIPDGAHFYFVHSYYPVVAEGAGPVSTAWCEYGARFAAAIERGRIYATQFHPEKSQRWGLRLLENFAALVKGGGRSSFPPPTYLAAAASASGRVAPRRSPSSPRTRWPWRRDGGISGRSGSTSSN